MSLFLSLITKMVNQQLSYTKLLIQQSCHGWIHKNFRRGRESVVIEDKCSEGVGTLHVALWRWSALTLHLVNIFEWSRCRDNIELNWINGIFWKRRNFRIHRKGAVKSRAVDIIRCRNWLLNKTKQFFRNRCNKSSERLSSENDFCLETRTFAPRKKLSNMLSSAAHEIDSLFKICQKIRCWSC